ncbi:hypothetical protein V8F20_004845 [Naviculisporaceae sp. PSN 640]
MDKFRVRLNCIDHYQATPTRYDPQLHKSFRASQSSKEPRVPVIRIFGSTETGQKVCAHIHGVFPYLYVDYGGSSLEKAQVGEYVFQFHRSIDHALGIFYRNAGQREQGRYVARITLVKGVPFYGFHVGYRFYLKIYMLNPAVMTRLADLLQKGVIMSRVFQPYEAHLQYLLQFMTDYNLYGCGYVESNKPYFRSPVPEHNRELDSAKIWDEESIPRSSITDDFVLPRVSHCSLEVDICAQDILNRHAIEERPLHHAFIERKHPLPPDLKLVHSMAGLWKDETERRRRRMRNLAPGTSPFPPEVLVSMSADPRHSQPPSWIHEEEYRRQIQVLIEEEKTSMKNAKISFSNFVRPIPLEETVKTVLQSVEDLYPENLLPALGLESQLLETSTLSENFDVDEAALLDLEIGEEEEPLPLDDDDSDASEEAPVPEQDAQQPPDASELPNNTENTLAQAFLGEQRLAPRLPSDTSEEHSEPESDQLLDQEIKELGFGLAVSGLRSNKRPEMPLYAGFALDAVQKGLVGKLEPTSCPGEDLQSSKKRHSPAIEESVPGKRIKVNESGPQRPVAENTSNILDAPAPALVKPKPVFKKNTTLSQGSQSSKSDSRLNPKPSSAKQHGSLKFPVVKDPQNANTKMRLSQQAGSQGSTPGGSDVKMKHVAFSLDAQLLTQDSRLLPSSSSGPASTPVTPALKTHPPGSPSHTNPGFSRKLRWEGSSTMFTVARPPPTAARVRSTMKRYKLPEVIYQDAFYSQDKDVPARPREYAGREFRIDGNSLPYLPDFDPTGKSPATYGIKPETSPDFSGMEGEYKVQQAKCTIKSWEIAEPPPSLDEVRQWWNEKKAKKKQAERQHTGSARNLATSTQVVRADMSQIAGATPKNKHGFKYSQKMKSSSVQHEAQYMSTMSLEIHVNTRGKLVPNPEEDEVQCIFWCFGSDENALRGSQSPDNTQSGLIILSKDQSMAEKIRYRSNVEITEESTELDLIVQMVGIVRDHDPDILTGYEVHGSSWGYLIERARFKYDYDLCDEFSRMKSQSHGRIGKDADKWGFNTTSTIRVTGRHMINIWRAMRGELNLLQYSMENVVWHLLHRRIPHYSWRTLTDWYRSGRPKDLDNVLRYYLNRTRLDLEILEKNELIPRTSEQARVLGVDFFSVFSRGSQFKVESIMFRIAKPENFMLVSPSRKQVGGQNALECLPLVMEPQSAFYNSPLLVLDFQSLYPSVMIAYNYCYSTFLGRIVNWRGTNKMGFTEYRRREGLLRLLKDYINIAPNGVMYSKASIRKSLLAKMLTEILEARVMVKSGMKQDKDDKALQQLLNNRQLALKLLANVTYGYTSASFSGRMPCSEIADSIVQTGRETLERAIAYIHSVKRWNAEVVYGDTDSLFIYLKGRTREQAFDIGAEMAKAITNLNPRPIKLKFEKVYHPCVLLAKKRYVGYKYESKDQKIPEFDAKGIETVRRDGTPAEQKIEEKALRILFETADLSQVKEYFQKQCTKIMKGQVSIQDFCFAREVKLGTYSDKGPLPPGAQISARKMADDARAEPQYGERVPYVVAAGGPGARLVDRCVAPEELLNDPFGMLDAEYYITKNLIPPLERIFNLVGANVRAWWDEMPRFQGVKAVDNSALGGGGAAALGFGDFEGGGGGDEAGSGKKTLEWFLRSSSCAVCGVKIKTGAARFRTTTSDDTGQVMPLCKVCADDTAQSMIALRTRLNVQERGLADVMKVCQSCAVLSPLDEVECDSKDCPVFYTRVKQAAKLAADRALLEPLVEMLGSLDMEKANKAREEVRARLDIRVDDLDW